MPRLPQNYPRDGWPTVRQAIYVQMNGTWLVANGYPVMLFADGEAHWTWRDWPGALELGTQRPRGCDGRMIDVAAAIPGQPGDAGLLRSFGATVAHVCDRLHHREAGQGWCWCDRCCNRRWLGSDR